MSFMELFKECRLCPRNCGVNRLEEGKAGHSGFCRENHQLRVGYVGPHFGEEPPVTGKKGSGTVFFSGCSLQCPFCQNHQISRDGLGEAIDVDELFKRVSGMVEEHHVQNINLVTPDHFFPHAFELVSLLRREGYDLPVVYNLSGYQSIPMLRMAEDFADIYLPDFKYANPELSQRLSKCRDYPEVALEAIVEMVRQKGFLEDVEGTGDVAKKGVLVRHLILPGHVDNSLNALTTLFLEFGSGLPISLMSQYHPVLPQKDQALNRFLTQEEFDQVFSHATDMGFERLFVQFLDQAPSVKQENGPFVPDFRKKQPFSWMRIWRPASTRCFM
jgi:putative pyruvate formate lyase activating enzyme